MYKHIHRQTIDPRSTRVIRFFATEHDSMKVRQSIIVTLETLADPLNNSVNIEYARTRRRI